MHARTAATALAAVSLMLVSVAPARAAVLVEIPINMMFSDISLSGSGPMPLGAGWGEVESGVTVTSSAAATSTMIGAVSFVDDPQVQVTVDLIGTFYLDLTFTDIDPVNDYGAGLGDSVSLPASAGKPLVIGLNFTVTQEHLEGISAYQSDNPGATIQEAVDAYNATATPGNEIALTVSDPGVETALGVDLNGNGFLDALTYFGSGLMFSSLGDLVFLTTSLLTGATISASAVNFTGGVDDLVADPPFSIALDGLFTLSVPVPAPASVLLLALGIAGMGARRVLRRAA